MEALAEKDEKIKISDLQQTQSWSPSVTLYKYEGIWYPERVIKGIVSFQKNFVPQPNDIFLCTTPKCGTTWLKALSFAILTRTRYLNGGSNSGFGSKCPLLSKSPQDLVPFIEDFFGKGKTRDPKNPLLHTHVPFSSLPKTILNSNSKIIYICRDPKDVFISEFFFVSKRYDDVSSFKEVYKMFCNGVAYNGPYWDHVLGYWKASLEFPERLLFLKYEDLKNNTYFYVKKIADFMGYGFSEDEEKKGTVEKIAQLCSFENLSKLDVNKSTHYIDGDIDLFASASFFRKGMIGDWKNYLTPQMAEKIDQITYEKFHAYGLNL